MATKNFIKRFISSPLVQAFLIYISGGWIALELMITSLTNIILMKISVIYYT